MDSEHRKIELQSPTDLTYLTSKIRTAARQKLDLHLPPVSDTSEPDELRRNVEELVEAFVAQVLQGMRHNISINGIDVIARGRSGDEDERGEKIKGILSADNEGESLVEKEEFEPFDDKLRGQLSSTVAKRDALIAKISQHRRTTPKAAADAFQEQFEQENREIEEKIRGIVKGAEVLGVADVADVEANMRQEERVVVLGSGWAGFTVARTLDSSKYQALVISPRSYFAFTPLLASTAVGTLEFRTALEPVRSRRTKVEFIQGWADDVDFKNKTITIEQAVDDARQITVGCYSQTFGTPGVKEHAFFLKDVGDARKIRNRILACFEGAALPTTSVEMKKQLLNFAVVGGGPTGIEFSAELHDLINEDMRRLYPELIQYHNITVYDVAEKVLPMFDKKLADYAMQKFKREGIQIKTSHHVEELRPGAPAERSQPYDVGQEYLYTLKVKEEGEIGVGMCVWSTGLMQNPFVASALSDVREAPTNLHIPSPTSDPATVSPSSVKWVVKKDAKSGSIITDDHLRVKLVPESSFSDSKDSKNASIEAIHPDVFALGDCGIIESTSYPATAQVASQKAFWLAKRFNKADINSDIDPQPSPASSSLNPTTTTKGFTYRDLGTLAYIGNWNALFQGGGR
ncbi:FAD/NAD-binding domain-containing protein [Pyrenophora tritici-repentis]|nr:FAD/NAD-binding domain-containing protein [Pyrenophora tritici-repentis]